MSIIRRNNVFYREITVRNAGIMFLYGFGRGESCK